MDERFHCASREDGRRSYQEIVRRRIYRLNQAKRCLYERDFPVCAGKGFCKLPLHATQRFHYSIYGVCGFAIAVKPKYLCFGALRELFCDEWIHVRLHDVYKWIFHYTVLFRAESCLISYRNTDMDPCNHSVASSL